MTTLTATYKSLETENNGIFFIDPSNNLYPAIVLVDDTGALIPISSTGLPVNIVSGGGGGGSGSNASVSGVGTTPPTSATYIGGYNSSTTKMQPINLDPSNNIIVAQSSVWNVNAIQSGTWATARTWVLSSGSDSISATIVGTPAVAQSGTWNNNIIQIAGQSIATGHGTAYTSLRVELPTDGTGQVYTVEGLNNYFTSTVNSSNTQLAAGATFTGGSIENILSYQAAQIQVVCDQPYTVIIKQYIDAGGTQLSSQDTFTRGANQGLNENVLLPGNYIVVSVTNNGGSPTTTFNLNTTYGILPAGPRANSNYGNYKTAVNEINGYPFFLGQTTKANSLPVTLATDTDSINLLSLNISTTGAGSWINTSNYQSIVMQFTGTAQFVITIEGSNDQVNANLLMILPLDDFSLVDNINKNGSYSLKTSTQYIRYNVQEVNGSILTNWIGRNTIGPSAADLLSSAMSNDQNNPLNINIKSGGGKFDAQGASIVSDAPIPLTFTGETGSTWIIDTSGYQTLTFTSNSTATGTVGGSNDQITWTNLQGLSIGGGGFSNAFPVSTSWAFPLTARYVRIVLTAGGSITAYLRQQPFPIFLNNAPYIAGATPVNAGIQGIAAIGGNIATGVAPTANPVLIAGIDTNTTALTRSLRTDTTGRILVAGADTIAASPIVSPFGIAGIDSQGLARRIGVINNTVGNTSAINIQDTTQFEGQSQIEILAQILNELKILTFQMSQLSLNLNIGNTIVDEPSAYRNDPSFLA